VGTGEVLQPKVGIGDRSWDVERETALCLDGLDESRSRKRSEVINCRNLGSIAIVVPVKEFLDKILRDVAEHVLDRLVLDLEWATATGP